MADSATRPLSIQEPGPRRVALVEVWGVSASVVVKADGTAKKPEDAPALGGLIAAGIKTRGQSFQSRESHKVTTKSQPHSRTPHHSPQLPLFQGPKVPNVAALIYGLQVLTRHGNKRANLRHPLSVGREEPGDKWSIPKTSSHLRKPPTLDTQLVASLFRDQARQGREQWLHGSPSRE